MESIIQERQDLRESTVFIEFTLSAIKASLIKAINMSDEMSDGKMDKTTLCWKKVEEHLKTRDYIMNADVQKLCGISATTANRILAGLVKERKLAKCRQDGHWAYALN